VFETPEQALLFLLTWEKIGRVIVWCINTEYDINNLSNDYPFLLRRYYNKSRFIFAKMTHRPDIVFYDLVNFYSLSAKAVGELFGQDKLDFDFNSRRFDEDGFVIPSDDEVEYCKQDANIAQVAGQFITDKLTEFDITPTATVASAAMQVYLRHYDPVGLTGFSRSSYVVDASRIYPAYYGGRCEVFRAGHYRKRMFYADINSLYPFVMSNFPYPNPMGDVRKVRTLDFQHGIVEAVVRVPKTYLPVLPVRTTEHLLFPTGIVKGTWTKPELDYAVEQGAKIEKVLSAYSWLSEVDLFSRWVKEIYEKRLASTLPSDSKFYKVLMNALYGKFAERRKVVSYVNVEDADIGCPIVYDMAEVETVYLPQHSHVILSAYVTTYGRLILHQYMKTVLDSGGDLYYCDTDSIVFSGCQPFVFSTKLGDLKLEHTLTEAEFIGAKYYRIKDRDGWQYRCKGVPAYCQKDMFKANAKAVYKKPIRFVESGVRKIRANVWIDTEKRPLTGYSKRRILENGDTTPKHLTSNDWSKS
jgi:hypothetical protein